MIDGPAGVIEAQHRDADRPGHPGVVALVAHPHPLFGGTMHNAVVQTAVSALGQHHIPTLAFNFRGVGSSAGTHDEGQGEVADLEAAISWLLAHYPASSLLLTGYSFGAATILRLPKVPAALAGVLLLAPPLSMHDFSKLAFVTQIAADGSPNVALIYGERDDFTGEELRHQFDQLPLVRQCEIDGAGHDLGAEHQQSVLKKAIRSAIEALTQRSKFL